MVAGAVLLLYAPWIPTLITQVQHTAAPWSDRPTALYLLWIPFTLFGEDDRWLATPLLMLAVVTALHRVRDHDGAIRVLAGLALGAALAARIKNRIGVTARVEVLAPHALERSLGKAKRISDER